MLAQVPNNFKEQNEIDDVFFTCCVLHNMLLEEVGKDSVWEKQSEWEQSKGFRMGQFDEEDVGFFVRFASRGLHLDRDTDCSGIGNRGAKRAGLKEEDSFWVLQNELVVHFEQMWAQHKVEWVS